MIRSVLVLLGVLWLGPAHAAAWTVVDLGRLDKAHHCMQAAQSTFQDMLGEVRIARLYASDWVAYADGMSGTHDAVITCTFGDSRGTRATLVLHSPKKTVSAHLLVQRIVSTFDAHAKAIAAAWRRSFE